MHLPGCCLANVLQYIPLKLSKNSKCEIYLNTTVTVCIYFHTGPSPCLGWVLSAGCGSTLKSIEMILTLPTLASPYLCTTSRPGHMFGSRSRAPINPATTIRNIYWRLVFKALCWLCEVRFKSIKHASHSVFVAGWEAHVVDVCEGVLHPVRYGVRRGEAVC